MLARLLTLGTAARLRLAGARSFRHEVGDVSLKVYRAGPEDGEPWVLLHGLGSTALSWVAPFRALRSECLLLAPELSALGGTEAPGEGLDVREGAAAVADLIERCVPGGRAHVAGISLGGWTAVRLALSRPELVERLLLVDPAGYMHQDWERIRELVQVETLDDVRRLYAELFARTPWLLRVGRRAFLAAYQSPAVRRVLSALKPEDAYGDSDLARLELPVGLVWGEHDGLFQLEAGRAIAAALPDGDLFVLSGCGHSVHWECPRALLEAFESFRRRTARPAPDREPLTLAPKSG